MSTLSEFRKSKDDFFGTDPQSPLDHDHQEPFTGLNYYPEDTDLRFDLRMEKIEKPLKIVMVTSTGDGKNIYTPYCAFSNRWSCQIPPSANRIPVRIEAGEKSITNSTYEDLFHQPW